MRVPVALDGHQAVRLARALSQYARIHMARRELTQAQLAKALSSEGRVAGADLELLGVAHQSQDTVEAQDQRVRSILLYRAIA